MVLETVTSFALLPAAECIQLTLQRLPQKVNFSHQNCAVQHASCVFEIES